MSQSSARLKSLASRIRTPTPSNQFRGGWVDTFRSTVLTQLLANFNQQGSTTGWTYIDYTAGPDRWDISRSVRRHWGINPVFDYGRAMSVLRHKDERLFMGHPFLGLMRRVREVNSQLDHQQSTSEGDFIPKLLPGFKYFPSTAALIKPIMREQDRAILCEKDPQHLQRLKQYLGNDHRFKVYALDVFEELGMAKSEWSGKYLPSTIQERLNRSEKEQEEYLLAREKELKVNRQTFEHDQKNPEWDSDPRKQKKPKEVDPEIERIHREAERAVKAGKQYKPPAESMLREIEKDSEAVQATLRFLGLHKSPLITPGEPDSGIPEERAPLTVPNRVLTRDMFTSDHEFGLHREIQRLEKILAQRRIDREAYQTGEDALIYQRHLKNELQLIRQRISMFESAEANGMDEAAIWELTRTQAPREHRHIWLDAEIHAEKKRFEEMEKNGGRDPCNIVEKDKITSQLEDMQGNIAERQHLVFWIQRVQTPAFREYVREKHSTDPGGYYARYPERKGDARYDEEFDTVIDENIFSALENLSELLARSNRQFNENSGQWVQRMARAERFREIMRPLEFNSLSHPLDFLMRHRTHYLQQKMHEIKGNLLEEEETIAQNLKLANERSAAEFDQRITIAALREKLKSLTDSASQKELQTALDEIDLTIAENRAVLYRHLGLELVDENENEELKEVMQEEVSELEGSARSTASTIGATSRLIDVNEKSKEYQAQRDAILAKARSDNAPIQQTRRKWNAEKEQYEREYSNELRNLDQVTANIVYGEETFEAKEKRIIEASAKWSNETIAMLRAEAEKVRRPYVEPKPINTSRMKQAQLDAHKQYLEDLRADYEDQQNDLVEREFERLREKHFDYVTDIVPRTRERLDALAAKFLTSAPKITTKTAEKELALISSSHIQSRIDGLKDQLKSLKSQLPWMTASDDYEAIQKMIDEQKAAADKIIIDAEAKAKANVERKFAEEEAKEKSDEWIATKEEEIEDLEIELTNYGHKRDVDPEEQERDRSEYIAEVERLIETKKVELKTFQEKEKVRLVQLERETKEREAAEEEQAAQLEMEEQKNDAEEQEFDENSYEARAMREVLEGEGLLPGTVKILEDPQEEYRARMIAEEDIKKGYKYDHRKKEGDEIPPPDFTHVLPDTHGPVNIASALARPLTAHAIIGIDVAEAITEGIGVEGDILQVDDTVMAATKLIIEESIHRFPHATYVISYPIFGRGYQDQLLASVAKTGVRNIIQATYHIQKGEPYDTASRVYDFEPWGTGVVIVRPPPGFEKQLKDIVNTMHDVMVQYGPSIHSSEEEQAVEQRDFPHPDQQANATFFVDHSIHYKNGWPNRPDVSWMTQRVDEHIRSLNAFKWEHFVPSFENPRSKRFELLARSRADLESDLWNYSRGYRGDDEEADKWLHEHAGLGEHERGKFVLREKTSPKKGDRIARGEDERPWETLPRVDLNQPTTGGGANTTNATATASAAVSKPIHERPVATSSSVDEYAVTKQALHDEAEAKYAADMVAYREAQAAHAANPATVPAPGAEPTPPYQLEWEADPLSKYTASAAARAATIRSVDWDLVRAQDRAIARMKDGELKWKRDVKRTHILDMFSRFQEKKIAQTRTMGHEAQLEAERIAQAKREGTWIEPEDEAKARQMKEAAQRKKSLSMKIQQDAEYQEQLRKYDQHWKSLLAQKSALPRKNETVRSVPPTPKY